MAKRKATIEICDNPDCESEIQTQLVDGVNAIIGFHLGKGSYAQDWGGGPLPAIFACSTDCIVAAIEHKIYEGRQ